MTRDTEKVGVTADRGPTFGTILELSALSLSTVSLSLRGGGALKEETRKIDEAARLVSYVPNRAGVRLRTQKTNVITFVQGCPEYSID